MVRNACSAGLKPPDVQFKNKHAHKKNREDATHSKPFSNQENLKLTGEGFSFSFHAQT